MCIHVIMQAFYNTDGAELITHKSDIWSGSLTMMYILVGLETKVQPHDQV